MKLKTPVPKISIFGFNKGCCSEQTKITETAEEQQSNILSTGYKLQQEQLEERMR